MQHDILVSGITDVSHMVRRSIGKDPLTLTCANPQTKQNKIARDGCQNHPVISLEVRLTLDAFM